MYKFVWLLVMVMPFAVRAEKLERPDDRAKVCLKSVEEMVKRTETKKDFSALYDYFKKHESCDDGANAEIADKMIAEATAHYWGKLASLQKLFDKDPLFRKFYFMHLESLVPGSENEMKTVQKKSTEECRPELAAICKEIQEHSQKALSH